MADVCKFFQMGACRAGAHCTYRHDRERGRKELVCNLFLHSKPKPKPSPAARPSPSSSSRPTPRMAQVQARSEHMDLPPEPQSVDRHWMARSPSLEPATAPYAAVASTGVEGESEQRLVRRKDPLCSFAIKGNCRFADRNPHGRQCEDCKLFCLHPLNTPEEDLEHLMECKGAKGMVVEGRELTDSMECTVCFEVVVQKKDPRFGILNCDHCVCLECIREWRLREGMETAKTCPICRVETHIVLPSTIWIQDRQAKEDALRSYKENLGRIDCRHFNFGEGTCPFGTSCLYRHQYRDGTVEEAKKLRFLQGGEEEEAKIMNQVLLSDFL
ncbi:hypothetical protein HDU96_002429 [Phlyctochytrium bullatum]|nr:hypothetical protein HDU96_002429 [Phlyctochytrium bullatum]